jgi:uncharacterized protein YkwD
MVGLAFAFGAMRPRQESVPPPGPLEGQLIWLTNESRTDRHLGPVRVDAELARVAQGWSETLSARFAGGGCAPLDNPDLRTAVRSSWHKLGENVQCADNRSHAVEIHRTFMRRPFDERIVVDPAYEVMGVGVARRGELVVVTELFADRDGPALRYPTFGDEPWIDEFRS